MKRFLLRFWFVLVVIFLCGAILVAGCGTKITLPEPSGLFSVSAYTFYDEFSDDLVKQLTISQGAIYVLKEDGLYKRGLEYGLLNNVDNSGLSALCIDDDGQRVFVWNGLENNVYWYSTTDLTLLGSTNLPTVLTCEAMATSSLGIEQVPGAATYLYISDQGSGVVHRFVFDEFNGLTPYGILARSDGDAVRFVHVAAGMARDHEDHLLVCDEDALRNWVIRFDSTPDLTDTTTVPFEDDPLRGLAAMFTDPVCAIAAPKEFVLGNAADCNQTDWEGGPSSAEGEFDGPGFVAVDGSGRIFVSDSQNDRVQLFSSEGEFELFFGNNEIIDEPGSLGVVDVRVSGEVDGVNYGAFVYIVVPGDHMVRRFISNEHYIDLTGTPPPPPN